MDDLDRLRFICPPPPSPSSATKGVEDGGEWAIPSDYAKLLEFYGPGCFDEFLWIYGEGSANIHQDLGHRTESMRQILLAKRNPRLREVLEENSLSAADIVQWAGTDNADSLLWLAVGPPDQWKTLALEAGALTFIVLAKSATRILSELMDGSLKLNFFPDDFPSDAAVFASQPDY